MSGKCCDVQADYHGNCPVHYRCPGFVLSLTRQEACELLGLNYGEFLCKASMSHGFLNIENNRGEESTFTQVSLRKLLVLPPDAAIFAARTRWGNLDLDINVNSRWNHEFISLALLKHYQKTGKDCICGDTPNAECPVHPTKCCERDTNSDGDCPVHPRAH